MGDYIPVRPHDFRYELNKSFDFSASHAIPDETAGKCQNVHGHTFTVNLTIVGNYLDETGFLVNFSMLKKRIHDLFDHRHLNDLTEYFSGTYYPTSENIAETILFLVGGILSEEWGNEQGVMPICHQVILRETPTSYVVVRS